MNGSYLAIIEFGEIGLETANSACAPGISVSGTKCTVHGARCTVHAIDSIEEATDNVSLPGLLSAADAVVNTLPGTAATGKLFNRDIFDAMKPGIVFVNVGRGTAVDEQTLLEALSNGRVPCACLDVFAVEPLPPGSPLWTHPKVIVSPRTSALSEATPPHRRTFCRQHAGFPRLRRAPPRRGHGPLLLGRPPPPRRFAFLLIFTVYSCQAFHRGIPQ